MTDGGGAAEPIRLLLADVDGTLVTPEKELTEATVAAVRKLDEAGVSFALTSGRPPRGMAMLIAPLRVRTPVAAFNGGELVSPEDMAVIEQRTIPDRLLGPAVELMRGHGLDAWVYRGSDWYVQDPDGPHVAREAATVQFGPTVRADYEGLRDAVKIVGVSDDHDAVAGAARAARERFGKHVSAACSQPYYLDVTHPKANKGSVVDYLAKHLDVPASAIATIGDMPNDVLMFARSGLSIAMGNADPQVHRAARHVTGPNDKDGFAEAVRRFVLPAAQRSER
ncbi:MAG TPA: Cof-type HAD-IIB family hydrolase [Solirubrobacteraceae bacterium]|nr:Cof-type HAD-IIB family hydrolase [Solirubrobacteraceae bacterium]